MSKALERLQRDIRDACPSGLWARGVALCRDNKVELESQDESEVVFRIGSSRGIAPTVVLYLSDRDWECDCDGRFDACEHVAAAIIALARANSAGETITRAEPDGAGRILYLFRRRRGQLELSREVIAADGTTAPLTRSLAAVVAGLSSGGPRVLPDRADLEADSALGPHPGPLIGENTARKLCLALAHCKRARLDDAPIEFDAESVSPKARVKRGTADSLVLSVVRAAAVDEVLGPGLALCGTIIRPLAAMSVTGSRLENLPLQRRFASSELGELVGKVLPALRREIEVEIATDVTLPSLGHGAKPRIDLGLRVAGGSVEVLPRLLYGQPPTARIDGDKLVHLRGDVPKRDRDAERDLVATLRSELNLVCNRSIGFRGEEATLFLRRYKHSSFAENAEQIASAIPLSAAITVENEEVRVRFRSEDGDEVEAGQVLAAWDAENQIVALDGTSFGLLPQGWLEQHGELVRDLLAAEGSDLRTLPPATRLLATTEYELPPRLARLEPLIAEFDELPRAPLPTDLAGELRDYQLVGLNWLRFLASAELGAILADDMGLGKTVQVLASLTAGKRSLVVAPTSTLRNWQAETEKFRPGLTSCLFHGAARELDTADVTITSYALLRRDIEQLESIDWDCVVLDEAQAIKNPTSQAARAARRLRARARIALSGTPVENRLEELWSIAEFANPGLLGNHSEFAVSFAKPIGDGDHAALARLRSLLRPVVLRRRKIEVAPELPSRIEVVVRCELDSEERELYDGVRAAARADVARELGRGKNTMTALTALLRLRQAACHRGLLPSRSAASSSKLDRLTELLVQACGGGHKALVFSQWTSFLDLVEPALAANQIAFTRLDGSTRDRAKVVDEFQSDGGPPVLLISLKAGGTGLNLTAADHVFLLDPWWNPAVEEQAADRAHRIGQDKPVLIHRMVAADTVEERMLELKARKLALAESALSDVGAGAALTRDELMALLE